MQTGALQLRAFPAKSPKAPIIFTAKLVQRLPTSAIAATFDYLVTGGILPPDPASAVRDPSTQ
jgi:hypothetical protein